MSLRQSSVPMTAPNSDRNLKYVIIKWRLSFTCHELLGGGGGGGVGIMGVFLSAPLPINLQDKNAKETGGWFNINMSSYQYRKFHCGNKTILRPYYLHNGISYTG